jgi:ferrous iron transport protein B
LFVYALVNTIYIPCVATFAMLSKELGTRAAVGISAFTIGLAVLVGGVAHHALAIL